MGGCEYTVNNLMYARDQSPYRICVGPSMRMIVEMSDPPRGRITNATGQAGQRMSPHFADQIPDWLRLDAHEMQMDRSALEAEAEGILVLSSRERGA